MQNTWQFEGSFKHFPVSVAVRYIYEVKHFIGNVVEQARQLFYEGLLQVKHEGSQAYLSNNNMSVFHAIICKIKYLLSMYQCLKKFPQDLLKLLINYYFWLNK